MTSDDARVRDLLGTKVPVSPKAGMTHEADRQPWQVLTDSPSPEKLDLYLLANRPTTAALCPVS